MIADKPIAIEGITGIYHRSRKQPGCRLRPTGPSLYPIVVFEVGYNESPNQLHQDAWLWLMGSGFYVGVYLLHSWYT